MLGSTAILISPQRTEPPSLIRAMSDDEPAPPPTDPGDPRDDAVLPPWIWLTLCTVSLLCLLFISFRRAKSLELYERAKDYLREKLSFLPLHRGVRLSEHDLEASLASPASRPRPRPRTRPSQDDISETHSGDEDDEEEEEFARSSPAPSFPSRRAYTLDTRHAQSLAASAYSALQRGGEALGWGTERGMRALRGEGEKRDGIARAFWGLRKGERAGGIRLGGADGGSSLGSERLASSARDAGRSAHGRTDSTGSQAIFDVGDDAEAGDAVELPHNFQPRDQRRAGQ